MAGNFEWTAEPAGRTVSRVEFLIDGKLIKTELTAPFRVFVDAGALRTAQHTFAVKAVATDGSTASVSAKARTRKSPGSSAKSGTQVTTTSAKTTAVTWDGEAFTRAAELRLHLLRNGVDWDSFLVTHPSVVDIYDLPSVTWDGKLFYTQRSLNKHLAKQKVSYRVWAARHPDAAALLAGRPNGSASGSVS